jgi:glycosyltransferase involved in cell wall biosynthesis
VLVSVIIPTYNREDSVLQLLESLRDQTMDLEKYEVIVIDDGSTSSTLGENHAEFPFQYKYTWQENQGATNARNNGAINSQGQILVFIDDDVTISPNSLQALLEVCNQEKRVIALGSIVSRNENTESVFTRIAVSNEDLFPNRSQPNDQQISYVECNTQILAIKRKYFFELDMLQDPTGGWPNWDDVDFGYRAHNAGFQFVRVGDAKGSHWDKSLSDLDSTSLRWFQASKSAVRLFQKYPTLRLSIPMYADKTPINWREDSLRLINRKVIRSMVSSVPVIDLMKTVIGVLEKYLPEPKLLRPLYRWVCGAYMYQGYHQGLREFGGVPERVSIQ